MSNHNVDIYALAGSGLKRQYTTEVATDVPIYIYDTDEAVETVNGKLGMQGIKAMTNYMDIQEGNKLVDENSKVYFVKKVRVKHTPIYQHLELVLSADYGDQLWS